MGSQLLGEKALLPLHPQSISLPSSVYLTMPGPTSRTQANLGWNSHITDGAVLPSCQEPIRIKKGGAEFYKENKMK